MKAGVWLTVALSLGAASWTACRSMPKAVLDGAPIATTKRHDGDPDLAREFELLSPHVREFESQHVAEFDLRNSSSSAREFCYGVEWFDRHGARIAVLPQLWYPARLGPGEILHVQARSREPSAFSFRLIVQRPEVLTP